MSSFVKALDFNGSISQLSFFGNDVKFRTIPGGIISIIIYLIGFAYFSYLMFMWNTQQLPPIVTTQLEFHQEKRFFELTNPLFVFSLETSETDKKFQHLQEFQEIYTQEIYQTQSEVLTYNLQSNPKGFDCMQQAKSRYDFFDPICINLNDQFQTNLAQNYKNRSQDVQVQFYIKNCNPRTDVRCLSIVDQNYIIYTLYSQWRLTLITQDVNVYTGDIVNIPQDYYFPASNQFTGATFNFDLKVQKTTYIIDSGILFPKEKKIEIVRSIKLNTIENTLTDELNTPFIATIRYSLDRQEQVIRVTHPKLGQILAELGSILQVLLFMGMMMNQFNNALMNAKVEETLVRLYFPEINFFQFIYNFRGKIKSISWKGKKILDGPELQHMKQLRYTLGQQVKSKLNYINILHEISRLQIQVQLQLPREEVISLKDFGYRLKLPDKFINHNGIHKYDKIQNLLLNYEFFDDLSRVIPQHHEQEQELERIHSFGDQLTLFTSIQERAPNEIIMQKIKDEMVNF